MHTLEKATFFGKVLTALRIWLIRLVAGKTTVIINAGLRSGIISVTHDAFVIDNAIDSVSIVSIAAKPGDADLIDALHAKMQAAQ